MPPPPPPPPPPRAPLSFSGSTENRGSRAQPDRPVVPSNGPPGAVLVELFVYNGSPFKDHWAYFIRSSRSPELGELIHAAGDVNRGFTLEFKRGYNLRFTNRPPSTRIPLQWVDGRNVDEKAMVNNGDHKSGTVPVCRFESSAYKAKAPEKSLNSADSRATPKTRVVQRNCQTWIVESADHLVADGIFTREIAAFLHALKQ